MNFIQPNEDVSRRYSNNPSVFTSPVTNVYSMQDMKYKTTTQSVNYYDQKQASEFTRPAESIYRTPSS